MAASSRGVDTALSVKADEDFAVGVAQLEAGRLEEAAESFRIAAERLFREDLADQSAVCLVNLGSTLEQMGRFDEALASLDRAAQLLERSGWLALLAECEVNRGVVLEGLGRLDLAGEAYSAAISLSASIGDGAIEAVARINLATVYEVAGQEERAVRELQSLQALELDKGLADAVRTALIRISG